MRKILIIVLLICCSCTKNIPSDSVVIDLNNMDHWYPNEGNFYVITEEPPDNDTLQENKTYFSGTIIFKPDSNYTKQEVKYKKISDRLIGLEDFDKDIFANRPLYLYRATDNQSGELIKIKKVDTLVTIKLPGTIYD